MADFSIDQDNLPGVKDVCRDFAVLEDHCLAHSLQEQEIESHLASNVHKSRLLQKDRRVAKRMQEEEDYQAKSRVQRQNRNIEQSDNEVAQEIQDQLVRQAERQRQQEEKDAAIARKLQEKERKEDKKRKKQQGASSVEPYREEKGAFRPSSGSTRGSRHHPPEPGWDEHPQRDPRAGRGGHAESRASRSVFFADSEEPRGPGHRKERPSRPPPPRCRDRDRCKEGDREGGGDEDGERPVETDGTSRTWRDAEKAELEDSEGLPSGFEESGPGRGGTREPQDLWEPQEEVPKTNSLMREDSRLSQHPGEPGWNAGGDYNMREVIQGVNHLDMQDREILDMEVARRLHEEELKANQADLRAAQVAQDEEIARLMMEEEERKGYKSSRDRERRRPDGERRAGPEEVVRPRLKEDCESQRLRSQKPARPPPPSQNYENVESSSPRKPSRPEPTNRGSHYRQ
ncbi:hypothetical protein AAFF_G00107760 [Aldrovandia affinis]|uniref:Coiled-coil domain-containing protein n=1 Tax=Aldrovandia affinis TaxID=143900 RepID=A0AAD7RU94_9TELE|nr:hypothetical protein AAFF_G00107760 [Aldrovandia affinis]